jgi:large conductance mechanosensitive channel
MGMIKEFKEFASKGNVVDLAVGVVIGGAFGKIVASFVKDILMPPIGLALGGVDFKNIKIMLQEAVMNGEEVVKEAVSINIGVFLGTLLDFIIIAFSIFMLIKGINKMKRKEEAAPAAPAAPPEPSTTEKLLMEIRDSLKK